jgi:ubiquinone/menaquinone biosynthesis C-methylase UbiE
VGFYSRVIFPRLLEIGFGTGLNLPHYPQGIRKITTVDPNAGMHKRAERRIRETGIQVDRHILSGERLPFGDNSFDCVVSTFTLCSVENVVQALAQALRVLKPGGRFLYLEHGLSPDPSIQKWQRRLNWLQRRLGDGCRLDRDIKALVTSQPFSCVVSSEFYMERTPKTHGFMYRGVAMKG